jgi:hypothetical protein
LTGIYLPRVLYWALARDKRTAYKLLLYLIMGKLTEAWSDEDARRREMEAPRPRPSLGVTRRTPGYNVDRVDVVAGLRELAACGYTKAETVMVIEYALMRWARGEEEAAQRAAIDHSFHGIKLICWIRVIAAARAGGVR